MSIIIHGITKEEFAKRMMGEGITIIDPDILGSFESFFGYRTEELPPHGRLIDADAIQRKMYRKVAKIQKVINDPSRWSEERKDAITDKYTVLKAKKWIAEAPTIIEAEGWKNGNKE